MTKNKSEYPVYKRGTAGYCQNLGKVHKSHYGEYFLLRFIGLNRPLYLVPASNNATKFRIFKDRRTSGETDRFSNLKGLAVLPHRGATYLKTNLFGFKDCFQISLIPFERKNA
jgi:hypothetical protein